jgi:hypothetical protein
MKGPRFRRGRRNEPGRKHSLDVDTRSIQQQGCPCGVVMGDAVFGLKGQKLYDLKGSNIYKLNGDLVVHFVGCARQGEAFGQNDRQAVPGRLGAVC